MAKQNISEKPASRVSALDAIDLDGEIHRILKEHLLKIIQALSPSWGKWEPEMDTFLRVILWKMSMYQNSATFGQQLLSVKYSHELSPSKACAWAVLSLGCPYFLQRASEVSTFLLPDQRDKILQLLGWLELCVQVASLVNFTQFLREGRYPCVADRMVGIRPVSAAMANRVVGYSFMTRELLWHGFVELIVFILPLVNYKYLKRCVSSYFVSDKQRTRQQKSLVFTVNTRCSVCQEPPVIPYHMGCAHAFCYYCLQSNRMADVKFECPSCGHWTEDSDDVQAVSLRSRSH